jgi:hypothetical protein
MSAAKNAADSESDLYFRSDYREKKEDIPHARNNWVCHHFKERRIVPTHSAIRSYDDVSGAAHLQSWLFKTSADGKSWLEVAREEHNEWLNKLYLAGPFPVAGGEEYCFIRLMDIGGSHAGNHCFYSSAWEIFGSLFE